MIWSRIERAHAATGDRAGDEIGTRLDAIRLHSILRTMQARHTVDDDLVGTRTANLGAHRNQELGEIDHLGFACGVLEDGLTIGERRCHHQILGTGHGDRIEH